MTQRVDAADGRDIVARWCALAERRLEYLSDMFETGRWRRYYSELVFLENIQEAKAAVETWRQLMTGEPSPGSAIDLDGLSGRDSKLSRCDVVREPVQRIELQQMPVVEPPREIPGDVLAALESHLMVFDAAATDVPDVDDMALPPLDLDVMQERYPLLRNAL